MTAIHQIQSRTNARRTRLVRGPATVLALLMALAALFLGGRSLLAKLPISDRRNFTVIGDTLYFTAIDSAYQGGLWQSDGTAAGTIRMNESSLGREIFGERALPFRVYEVGEKLFFVAVPRGGDQELWVTDGVNDAVTIPLPSTFPSDDTDRAVVGNRLFFVATDGTHGRELWVSDGTVAGTGPVKDIRPGEEGSTVSDLTAVGEILFFSAKDDSTGAELWQSDGTEAGTVKVKDINPLGASSPFNLINVNGMLYFTATDGVNGGELWRSDGTADGTFLLKDIFPGEADSTVPEFQLEPFNASPRFSNRHTIVASDDAVYFTAHAPETGAEIWKTDGTSEGTVPAVDLVAGASSSTPGDLVAGSLWFTAKDPVTTGRELFRHDPATGETIRLTGPQTGVDEQSLYLPFVQR